MNFKIRRYRESDAVEVGCLIAQTFQKFNLSYARRTEQEKLLGPFRHAGSDDVKHRERIASLIRAATVLVAQDQETGQIVGVLRGSPGRLHSLFVRESHHRHGIGRRLMATFERTVRKAGCDKITMQATLYAVPFYQCLGYRRSTGARVGVCFDGTGFKYQPMKKVL